MNAVWVWLDNLFYRKLCGRWGIARKYQFRATWDYAQYRLTGRIARFFHRLHCEECRRGTNVD